MSLLIYELFLDSVKSLYSEPENKYKPLSDNHVNKSKKHNFVQKIIVIPEVCGQCLKKFVENNSLIILMKS